MLYNIESTLGRTANTCDAIYAPCIHFLIQYTPLKVLVYAKSKNRVFPMLKANLHSTPVGYFRPYYSTVSCTIVVHSQHTCTKHFYSALDILLLDLFFEFYFLLYSENLFCTLDCLWILPHQEFIMLYFQRLWCLLRFVLPHLYPIWQT